MQEWKPWACGSRNDKLTEAPSVELEEFFGELLAVSELARAKSDAELQDLHQLVEDACFASSEANLFLSKALQERNTQAQWHPPAWL